MDSIQQRRDEIAAKKAKLAELKRQREMRQKEISANRQSVGDSSELVAPTPSRADNRRDLDSFISSLVGESRPSSTGPGTASPAGARGSRPTSVVSAGQLSGGDSYAPSSPPGATQTPATAAAAPQNLAIAPLMTVYEYPGTPKPEVTTYSKAVQTTDAWSPPRQRAVDSDSEEERLASPTRTPRASKRLSRRERERDEELRENIRKEIEEELKAVQEPSADGAASMGAARENFPARSLTNEELNAVTSSEDFLDFVERSSKVIERALDEEYDILADYALGGQNGIDDDDDRYGAAKGRRVKEIAQFWDGRWSKKRMISDLGFSPKFPELVLASYTKNPTAPHEPDGLVQVWNLHMHDRPEYVFHAQSDILTAKFSPFHPNLIVGGAYSGQVLLWDTRAKSAPVQKTPLTGSGHTHPVYSIDIVGTQNANNIISCSTDGVVCGWSVDMLAQPQEYLELVSPAPAKTEDMAPTCIAFPQADPTYFLAGSEEGPIYPCHRYDRAGAKAGVDTRVSYRSHAAPVMSLDFHPARGPIDLGDLVLSASLDWSVKLWKVRAPAASSTTSVVGAAQVALPLADFVREDLVYDARWSPVKPGVFALVDGAGTLEVWDINVDVEVPVAKATPSDKRGASFMPRSLNKVGWEPHEGKKLAVGGLDGTVSVFEVGADLGGLDNVRAEEWAAVKKYVSKLDTSEVRINGVARQ
ncbi:WD domain-containing protein [Lineolata rhizophorae]|uniref:WD domain-containing protein n=1 Tax=Lineolata rhizophorae TaxID=578093 RepID=A0A6A6P746_9PEZI|nr:WD domain-containing protein [Lineolata rhizophorae]